MTRDEYEISVWQNYFAEAERRGVLRPTKYADENTERHMKWAAAKNRVPWIVPSNEE